MGLTKQSIQSHGTHPRHIWDLTMTHMGLRLESWQDSTNDKTQSILKVYFKFSGERSSQQCWISSRPTKLDFSIIISNQNQIETLQTFIYTSSEINCVVTPIGFQHSAHEDIYSDLICKLICIIYLQFFLGVFNIFVIRNNEQIIKVTPFFKTDSNGNKKI